MRRWYESRFGKGRLSKSIFRIRLIFSVPKKNLDLTPSEKSIISSRKLRRSPIPFAQKASYMRSSEWKLMQKVWLHEKGYRCQMFPFLVLGSHKPKGGWWNDAFYGKYAVHHMDRNAYENLGLEKSGDNVLVLSKFGHDWVFHWLLSFGARKAGDQKMLKFANPVQRIANKWCLVNVRMKIIVPLLIILLITLI